MVLKGMLSMRMSLSQWQGFDIGFNRGLIYESIRHLRGRIPSQVGSDFQNSNESFDEELDFSRHSSQLRQELPQIRQLSQNSDYYDSRKKSYNLYERAKQTNYDLEYEDNRQEFKDNRYKREKFDRNSHRNRFDANQSYEKDVNYDRDFDYVDTRNEYRQRHNYQGFNRFERNESQGYDKRNQSQGFDKRNQYNDRRDSRIYKSYKNRNHENNFDDQQNNEYRSQNTNEFGFENGRPRFSRNRELDIYATKKQRKLKQFMNNDSNNETDISSQDFQVKEDFKEETDLKGRERKLTSIPYNVTLENRFEVLNQIVTPLHCKPYEYQLTIKYRKNVEILQIFGKKLKDISSPVVRDGKGLPCPLESVKPSPMTERYRNKDEYSIWPGIDGFRKTVGFFVGQPSIHHNVICVEPDHIVVSKQSHIGLAKKFQNYLKEISKYDSCENFGKGGNWRRFHVRSNELGNHMAVAIMHPQQLSQQELDEEMLRINEYFKDDPIISSLYFQASPHTRSTHIQAPYSLLSGDKTITETLFDKKFEISVDSFFQINRTAAEVLYRNIISEINGGKKTTVLDICCGTGTLANLVAPHVSRVIGIDSSESAIIDAKRNSTMNGVKNVSFISGKVEEQLPKLMDELYSEDIVVVANPTRGGLHSSTVNVLREMNFIRKIIYVSCYPEGNSLKNFLHLCMPSSSEKRLGSPFVPTNSIPVDLFPHTNHCELIITFERF